MPKFDAAIRTPRRTAQEMTDLPLMIAGSGRDFTTFAFAVTPNVGGNSWTSYISGSQAFTTAMYIDGSSTDSGIVGDIGEQEPSMDAIQEQQIDTAGLTSRARSSLTAWKRILIWRNRNR